LLVRAKHVFLFSYFKSRQEPYVLELDIFGVGSFQYATFPYSTILSQSQLKVSQTPHCIVPTTAPIEFASDFT